MILRKALLKSFCPNLGKLNLSSFTNGQRFSISSTEKKEMIVLTARCEFTFPDSPVLCSNLPPASVCCRDNAPNSQEPFPSLQLCEFPTSFRNSPPVESRPLSSLSAKYNSILLFPEFTLLCPPTELPKYFLPLTTSFFVQLRRNSVYT